MNGFFKTVDKIKPLYDATYKVMLFVCKIFLIADICITGYAVLGRYLGQYVSFLSDPKWSEEVVLTLMAYMAVLSGALAIRRKAHIRMTAFDKYLPTKVIKALDIINDVCVLALAVVMLVVGWKYAIKIGAKGNYFSMPKVSRFWMYFPIPVAGFAMIIFELEAIYNHIKSFFEKEVVGGDS